MSQILSGGNLLRQISAGAIVGLSAVIYSISYGALLFSGALATHIGFGITVALITAIIGALFGLMSEEKTFISGPDSNTISVAAGMLAVLGSLGLPAPLTLTLALEAVFLTAIISALAFFALAKFKLADLVRYIPFSVMAGFLASTGWLMASGALNIISGTPLSMEGMDRLLASPYRPELLFGFAVVATLYALAPRVSGAMLIPLVILIATAVVNAALISGMCSADACNRHVWLFSGLQDTQWLPPWKLNASLESASVLIAALPLMLVVAFVGTLTILLSLASLELSYRKEFDLNRVLKAHSASAGVAALLGGFVGIISIGRTTLNQKAGGGALSGIVAALICLAMLLGAGGILAYIPKAALGGLVLYLGVNMLKQWLWDQRKATTRDEFAQIVLILVMVANYGYLVGFAAGVVISCIIFVLTYSRVPLASLSTDLSLLHSSVVRSDHEQGILRNHGHGTVIYRLCGYVFFGSASKIDQVFQKMNIDSLEGVVLDFTGVSGVDRSAIGVFQRILRRYHDKPVRFYFAHAEGNRESLRSISQDAATGGHIDYFDSLDDALECAEKDMIAKRDPVAADNDCFEFLAKMDDRDLFRGYCELKPVSGGETLCRDGDFSDAIYFVESGSLDIVKITGGNAQLRLARLSKGAMVGEMAFYTGEARTASIFAAIDSSVQILHKDALQRMRIAHPDLAKRFDHMVIRKVSESLTRANRLIATLG